MKDSLFTKAFPLAAVLTLLLTACGGNGGGVSPPSPADQTSQQAETQVSGSEETAPPAGPLSGNILIAYLMPPEMSLRGWISWTNRSMGR